MALIIALLVFVGVFVLIAGLWWAMEGRRRMAERLHPAPAGPGEVQILRTDLAAEVERGRPHMGPAERLSALCVQADYGGAPGDIPLFMGGCAVAAAILVWLRTWSVWSAALAALVGAAVPVIVLLWRRQRRLQRFDQAFPEALEAMARMIRSGNALNGTFQVLGEDMPDPIGTEFRRVSEQTRLGMDAGETLSRLAQRVPTEDVRFFCAAIRIQRASGGNLAEVLDRLSEVIRERFKILSHARVLSAQHRWSALLVGASPLAFAAMFQILNPSYFDPLFEWPHWPLLLGVGLIMEVIGFVLIWRIAKIEV